MTEGLKAYPSYKPSGVPWLGDMPEHWDMRRGKALFRCVDIRSRAGDEELLTVSSEHGVVPRKSATVTMFKAESYTGHKLCWPGDLVINSLWAWGRGLGVSRYHGIVSSAYGVYRLRSGYESYSAFIHELVRSTPFHWELQVRSKGVWISRLQITDEAFLGAPFPLPPPDEQSAIVRYLHYMDRRIRKYIRAKQKLIGLLNEQKQVIIHKAVTRGLDPHVQLKPSGVPWLGDVPEQWEVLPLKFVSRKIQNGATPPTSDESYYERGTIPWYGPSSIGESLEVGKPVRHVAESAVTAGKARLIQGPAVLVVIIGATAGRMALLSGSASTNQQITAYELRTDVIQPEFAIHQLRTAEVWLRATASTETLPILDSGTVARMNVAVPPVREQQSILQRLADQLQPFDATTTSTHREISLLREYRTRLIADVVTGKLDVREAAAGLPEEAGEPPDEIEAGVDDIEDSVGETEAGDGEAGS